MMQKMADPVGHRNGELSAPALIPCTLLQLPVQTVMAGRAEDINQESGCLKDSFKLGGT